MDLKKIQFEMSQQQDNVETDFSLVETSSGISSNVVSELSSLCNQLKTSAGHDHESATLNSLKVLVGSTSTTTDDPQPTSSNQEADEQNKVPDICERPQAMKRFKHPSSKRQQLTADDAAQIYLMRPTTMTRSMKRGTMMSCKLIAPKFGVSPKTIRDIWRGRTWIHATEHLWTHDERVERAHRPKAQNDEGSSDAEDESESDEDRAHRPRSDTSSQNDAKFENSDSRRKAPANKHQGVATPLHHLVARPFSSTPTSQHMLGVNQPYPADLLSSHHSQGSPWLPSLHPSTLLPAHANQHPSIHGPFLPLPSTLPAHTLFYPHASTLPSTPAHRPIPPPPWGATDPRGWGPLGAAGGDAGMGAEGLQVLLAQAVANNLQAQAAVSAAAARLENQRRRNFWMEAQLAQMQTLRPPPPVWLAASAGPRASQPASPQAPARAVASAGPGPARLEALAPPAHAFLGTLPTPWTTAAPFTPAHASPLGPTESAAVADAAGWGGLGEPAGGESRRGPA